MSRFHGTAYKGGELDLSGQTTDRGKLDVKHKVSLPKKSVWIYPLVKNFRDRL